LEFINIDEEEKIKKIFEYILQWLRIFLPKRPGSIPSKTGTIDPSNIVVE